MNMETEMKMKMNMDIDIEKIKAILLAAACFFMACLNLWNIFKDWFDRKYQSRKGQDASENQPSPAKKPVPDIIGKSKFKLNPDNYPPKKQEVPSKEEKPVQEEDSLRKEIAGLKELVLQQSKMIEENKPFLSIPMEKEAPADTESVNLEEEVVTVMTEKERSPFSTGTGIDEFELVVRTLKGKPITKDEEAQVGQIIPKIEGTDIYHQFTRQIQGAEEQAMEILNRVEDGKQTATENEGGFDFGKYIRE